MCQECKPSPPPSERKYWVRANIGSTFVVIVIIAALVVIVAGVVVVGVVVKAEH